MPKSTPFVSEEDCIDLVAATMVNQDMKHDGTAVGTPSVAYLPHVRKWLADLKREAPDAHRELMEDAAEIMKVLDTAGVLK